jgi:TRAP-type uncharacterized transport system fused permease subunit
MEIINLLLCIAILLAGCAGYERSKNKMPFQIGVAFGLFGISHLIRLMHIEESMGITFTLLRVSGYLIMLFIIFKAWIKR